MRVAQFAIRRVVAGLFTLVAMLTLTFVVFWAIPTQPEHLLYPSTFHVTEYQLHKADQLMGLDRSKLDQYFTYLWHDLRFDFGRQWQGETINPDQTIQLGPPIAPTLYSELRETLSLIFGGAVLVLLFAIPLGTFAGSRIGSISDRTISIVALIGVCTHPMVLGLILRSTFGHHLGWAPQTGYCPLIKPHFNVPVGGLPVCGGPADWASHLILPWITFALLFLALYTRMVRASVAETLHEDFVRTARSKGASEFRVLTWHVLPNATLRILTMIGMEIGTAIGVCIYIEAAFGLTGLGRGAVTVFGGNAPLDLPTMLAYATILTLIVVIGNLVVDVLYAVLDPRAGRVATERGSKSFAGGVI